MKQSLSNYLVKKYLRFDKSQPFITVTALLAFVGVAIGVMVLLIAMAIMNGFDKEFERKLFTMNYPLTLHPTTFNLISETDVSQLKKEFAHLKFSPYLSSQVILKKGSKLEGGLIFGVDFEKEKEINSVLEKAIKDVKIDKYDIVVGNELRKDYYLQGDEKLTLIFTQSDPGGFSLIPKMKRFNYKSYFESGLTAYDKAYMFTTKESLAKILNYPQDIYDGVHIYSEKPFEDIEKIKKVLPDGITVVGWWQMNGNFFSALALEKRALFIVLMLIILIASLNIISSLLMTVMNRRHEIALLLSLGAYKEEIKKAFFLLGTIIGGGGMLFGVVLGFLGIFLLGSFDLVNLPADVYGSSKLPLELSLSDFLMITIGASIIVALSAYYPAYKSTQIDVLDTLRNE